jgi:hypothetical protein
MATERGMPTVTPTVTPTATPQPVVQQETRTRTAMGMQQQAAATEMVVATGTAEEVAGPGTRRRGLRSSSPISMCKPQLSRDRERELKEEKKKGDQRSRRLLRRWLWLREEWCICLRCLYIPLFFPSLFRCTLHNYFLITLLCLIVLETGKQLGKSTKTRLCVALHS